MVQLSDRLAAIAREHAQKRQVRGDEELAEAFRLIDERILYMARYEARRLLTDVFGIAQEEVDAKVPDPDAVPERQGR